MSYMFNFTILRTYFLFTYNFLYKKLLTNLILVYEIERGRTSKINVNDIKKEVERIKKAVVGFRRMDEKATEILEKEGFEFKYLGTGWNSNICSMEINIIDTRMNKIYKNDNLLLAVGICCEKYGKGSLYRAYVKEITDSENFTKIEVEELRKIL